MAATNITVRVPTEADMESVAARMRPVEVDEVMASAGQLPIEACVLAVVASSEAWAVLFDGVPAFLWGVAPVAASAIRGRVGAAWLLTTDLVERKARAFWRYCQLVLPALMREWDELVNAIDCRHVQALRWAHRLGFELFPPEPFGVAGLPFCRFRVTLEGLHV